jgi:transposase-like protein
MEGVCGALGIPITFLAPGIIRAIEECFPRSARQRCLAHRMRNLAAKVPTDLWPEFKTRVAACYQAPAEDKCAERPGQVDTPPT